MKLNAYVLFFITGLTCFKKPYNPPVTTAPNSYLVVEGVINGTDSTIIKLSRTVKLSDNSAIDPETNASVIIESDDQTSFTLPSIKNGIYATPYIALNANRMYRLKIVTADNRVYQSDFVPVKNSPPADSLTYQVKSNGVQFYVNTHDAQNNTRYYRWEYNETWLFYVAYSSSYLRKANPDTIVARPVDKFVYQCWLSDTSSTIVLSSSAKLSSDVISNQPITFIPSTSEKFENLYSIQLKQYALTLAAFNYWQQLKKNTEQLGSIFDAEPSEIGGNLHCISNPLEPVIGYISAGAVVKTRIFIDSRKLPAWSPVSPYGGCSIHSDAFLNSKTNKNEVAADIYEGFSIPVQAIVPRGSPIITGYTASTAFCADCTTRGTNIKPAFWP